MFCVPSSELFMASLRFDLFLPICMSIHCHVRFRVWTIKYNNFSLYTAGCPAQCWNFPHPPLLYSIILTKNVFNPVDPFLSPLDYCCHCTYQAFLPVKLIEVFSYIEDIRKKQRERPTTSHGSYIYNTVCQWSPVNEERIIIAAKAHRSLSNSHEAQT